MDTTTKEHAEIMEAIYRASDLSRETAYALVALTVRHTIADVAAYVGAVGAVEGRPGLKTCISAICEHLERRILDLADDDEYVEETANEALFKGGYKS